MSSWFYNLIQWHQVTKKILSMKNFFREHPLRTLILFGFTVRIIAAIFSKGFLTLDDHFNLVVDADTIANGIKLPLDYKDSVLYPWSVSLIMSAIRFFGNTSPDMEMLVVRLLQAAFSTLGIYFVYKILETISGEESANLGGLLMASFFILPITAVHQFEESICQIPLLASIWFVVRNLQSKENAIREQSNHRWYFFLAGIFLGIAMILRLPLLSFALPFVLFLFLQSSTRKHSLFFFFGFALILLLQAASNVSINHQFGYSFLERYVNVFKHSEALVENSGGYPAGPPWRYAITLLGIFLPPFSFLFVFASFKSGKKNMLLSLPTLSFFVAHSLIANKQERFLLPIIPLIIIISAIGFVEIKKWFEENTFRWKIYKSLWMYFLVLNFLLLSVSIFVYGKKDRVEPLVYIQHQHNATGIIFAEFSYTFLVPEYYFGKPMPTYIELTNRNTIIGDIEKFNGKNFSLNYCVLYSNNIEQDKILIEQALKKKLLLQKEITPSVGDWLAHKLNPKFNKTNTATVYSISD